MGRAPCCDKANVKRGPWSPEEDATLLDYIHKYGNGGNWISLPQKAGLKRCGKSCRLRWLNYLRPDIKHGGFTPEEDLIICNLYSSMGSRWSTIASHLPGRTDNDVKNHWNTKLKKRLKMGGKISGANSNAKSTHHMINIYQNNAIMEQSSISTIPENYHLVPFNPGGSSSSSIDCINNPNSSTMQMPPLMEMSYNQYPLPSVSTEVPTFWPGEILASDRVISSQEVSTWVKLENVEYGLWPTSGSLIQDEDGMLPEYGLKTTYELLNGFGVLE